MARTTQTAPKPNVVSMPERRRPEGMWRMLLAKARAMAPRNRGAARHRLNPFTPAQPPPNVVPSNRPQVPQMALDAAKAWQGAMDQAPGDYGAYGAGLTDTGWLGGYAGQYLASSYEEGQQWLGYAVLALLSQRPEYRVMTKTFAEDMTREWIQFKSKSDNRDKQARIDQLEERLKKLRLQQVTKQAIENDGFQGRGQIYIDTGDDDPEELKTSIGSGGESSRAKFGRDGLAHDRASEHNKIKGLAAIEPMWSYPAQYNSDNPLSPNWYRPETWWVMGKEIHRTRLLTFVGNPVPDMLKPAYSFGGLSRTQMAKPYVDFYLRNRTSASDLLNNFSNVVLATELDVSTMEEGSELFQRVATSNVLRDNQGMFVINKDSEELSIVAAPIGGVKDLVAQAAEHMALPSKVPLVKLFGDQLSGLNASSEGVIRLWYDSIHADQEGLLREPIQTIVNLVMIELWGKVDDDIVFDFISLWQLDDAGKAAIQKTKADQRAVDIEAGIVLPEEARLAVAHDPDNQYAGLDLHEPLPEPDPDLLAPEGGGEPGGNQQGFKPSRRDMASSITNRAANFGNATSGDEAQGELPL